jgi:hypothetical protein
MSLSVIMTVNKRSVADLTSVLSSFRYMVGNDEYEEMVIVNDRGDRAVLESCLRTLGLEARIVDIDGPPGRLCPSKAWNAGFAAATSTHYLCISSDTVLIPKSVRRAREITEILPDVITFGRAEHCGLFYSFVLNKTETRAMTTYFSPDPLGFVWIVPAAALAAIDPPGYDEIYMGGSCYEDNDIVQRLWLGGYDFLFCDDIHGFHLEHGRTFLVDKDGLALVKKNEEIFKARFGLPPPMDDIIHKKLYGVAVVRSMLAHDHSHVAEASEKFSKYHTRNLAIINEAENEQADGIGSADHLR